MLVYPPEQKVIFKHNHIPTGIIIADRVPPHISVAILSCAHSRLRHNTIRLGEMGNHVYDYIMANNTEAHSRVGAELISRTFESLQYPNYRLWFIGQLASLAGSWMQSTAQGYLVYDLTHSTAYLGYLSFASGLPTWIFTLYGGVITDRIPRRTMIMVTQVLLLLQAAVLALLVFTGRVTPIALLVLSFVYGLINSFDLPARQAFVSELVERKSLTNAIALNGTMFNAAIIFGPAIGGLIYAWGGPGWCFLINAVSFLCVLIALAFMRIAPLPPVAITASVWTGIKDGLQFVRNHQSVRVLITGIAIISAFGFSLVTLLPAWAVDVLGGDVRTNGLLLSARGVGALGGALTLAAIGYRNIRGKLWALGSFLLPVTMLVFALLPNTVLSFIVLIAYGWALMMLTNNTNALIQSHIPDHLRGRVMSIYSLIFVGSTPLGSLLAGWVADSLGVPAAIIFSAAVLLLFGVFIWLRQPHIRQLE